MKLVPAGVRTVSARGVHAIAELLAQAIDLAVIRAHALAHDPRRDADHVRVADPAPLDDRDDGHARGELAFLGLHAQDPGVGLFERIEDCGSAPPASAAVATDSMSRHCARAWHSARACSRLAATSLLASSAMSATRSPG